MKQLYIIFTLTSLMTFGQEVEKYNYPNGQLKSEITYNKDQVLTKYCNWDQFGNLLTLEDYSILYKEYPKRDFSKVNWTAINDGTFISKFNRKDTNVVVKDSSFVVLNYQCYFSNGQMLDNTFSKNCPLQTRLDYMVKGFVIGVMQMKPGETALIKIDPKYAFGDKAAGNVPAKSTLIYLVELISVD